MYENKISQTHINRKEMSYKLTENDSMSEAPKKLPYNLREKREKNAAYRTMIRAELADE